MRKAIFISYSHKDTALVLPIIKRFDELQLDYWWDEQHIEGGDLWKEKINRGINACSIFLPIITENYRLSTYCALEINTAKNRDKHILPLYYDKIRDETIDSFFNTEEQYMDVKGLSVEDVLLKLEKSSLIQACSKYQILKEINIYDYEYVKNAENYVLSHSSIYERVDVMYHLFLVWFYDLLQGKNYKDLTLGSFDVYALKTNDKKIVMSISTAVTQSPDEMREEDVIEKSRMFILFVFNQEKTSLNEDEAMILQAIEDTLSQNITEHHVFFDLFYQLYQLTLYMKKDSSYEMNRFIITKTAHAFYKKYFGSNKGEYDALESGLFTDITLAERKKVYQSTADIALMNLVSDAVEDDIFLYGEGGVGKTAQLVEFAMTNEDTAIYIPLELLHKEDSTIIHTIIENNELGYDLNYEKLVDYAKGHRTYLLIDSIHKANHRAKFHIVEEIKKLTEVFYVILTSRTKQVLPNYSLLKDKEFESFIYAEYNPLTRKQIENNLKLHGIDFDYQSHLTLMDLLSNNLRLRIFYNILGKHHDHTLTLNEQMNQITSPGELLKTFFIGASSNSILSRLIRDNCMTKGYEMEMVYRQKVLDIFDEIEMSLMNNTDFSHVLTDEFTKYLTSSLSIFELNQQGRYDFFYQEYKDYFIASFLSKKIQKIVDDIKKNQAPQFSEIEAYLTKENYTYHVYVYLANLMGIHKDTYDFERLFYYISKHDGSLSTEALNRLFIVVSVGLNTISHTFNFYGVIKKIPEFMFENCQVLHAIRIPEGVIEISRSAFYHCDNLETVVFPESLKIIRSWAFIRCMHLKVLHIPKAVQSIGTPAFIDCRSLVRVSIDENNKYFDHDDHHTMLLNKKKNHILYVANGLKDVVIPETVTEIKQWAFKDCRKIEEIRISKRVQDISSDAFDNCFQLKRFIVDDANRYYVNNEAHWLLKPQGLKTSALIRLPGGTTGEVIIPDSVTHIMEDSLSTCNQIESIKIHEHVDFIGNYAMADCYELKTVTFDNLSSVTALGKYIFLNNSSTLTIKDQFVDKIYTFSSFDRMFSAKEKTIEYRGNFTLDWYKILHKAEAEFIVLPQRKQNIDRLIVMRDLQTTLQQESIPKLFMFGLTSYENLCALSSEKRKKEIESWIVKYHVMAIMVTRDLPIFAEMIDICEKYGCTLIRIVESLTKGVLMIETYLKKQMG